MVFKHLLSAMCLKVYYGLTVTKQFPRYFQFVSTELWLPFTPYKQPQCAQCLAYFVKSYQDSSSISLKVEAVAQTINIAKEYEEASRGFIDKQVKTFGKKMKIKLTPLG